MSASGIGSHTILLAPSPKNRGSCLVVGAGVGPDIGGGGHTTGAGGTGGVTGGVTALGATGIGGVGALGVTGGVAALGVGTLCANAASLAARDFFLDFPFAI